MSIPGSLSVGFRVGEEATLDYCYPHLLTILPKSNLTTGAGNTHSVIRHRDKIYCPSLGLCDFAWYSENVIGHVVGVHLVPYKGQAVPKMYQAQYAAKHLDF